MGGLVVQQYRRLILCFIGRGAYIYDSKVTYLSQKQRSTKNDVIRFLSSCCVSLLIKSTTFKKIAHFPFLPAFHYYFV